MGMRRPDALKENGIPPAPERPSTLRTFMKSHGETLAAADFFQIEVWTRAGLRTFFVLFAIRIASRRALAGRRRTGERPDGAIVVEIKTHRSSRIG